MSPTRRADPDLDDLITEITIDCHDEDEQLQAFENAFDEDAHFPCPATVAGQDVEVLSAGTIAHRRELIATCRRAHDRELGLGATGGLPGRAARHRAQRRPHHITPARGIPPLERPLTDLNSYLLRSLHTVIGVTDEPVVRPRRGVGASCAPSCLPSPPTPARNADRARRARCSTSTARDPALGSASELRLKATVLAHDPGLQ